MDTIVALHPAQQERVYGNIDSFMSLFSPINQDPMSRCQRLIGRIILVCISGGHPVFPVWVSRLTFQGCPVTY